MAFDIKDSGKREQYDTGAVRDTAEGKGAYWLIPDEFVDRLAKVYERGAGKYTPRNWEQGIPFSRLFDSALRHMHQAKRGLRDEDHLGHAAFNIAALITFEERGRGDLDDLADHFHKDSEESPYCEDDYFGPHEADLEEALRIRMTEKYVWAAREAIKAELAAEESRRLAQESREDVLAKVKAMKQVEPLDECPMPPNYCFNHSCDLTGCARPLLQEDGAVRVEVQAVGPIEAPRLDQNPSFNFIARREQEAYKRGLEDGKQERVDSGLIYTADDLHRAFENGQWVKEWGDNYGVNYDSGS